MDWKIDWDHAVRRQSEALRVIVAELFVLLGLVGGAAVSRIPPTLHRAVLRVLRPAESALRRLIVIAARGLVVEPAPSRPMPKGKVIAKGAEGSLPAFRLCDPRKDFPELRLDRVKYCKYPPRILFFGPDSRIDDLWPARPPKAAPPADGLVNGQRIARRLEALKLALDDIPRQARRLARWRLKREAMPGQVFKSPLRPGRAPGARRKPTHEVDEILTECHGLAWEALKPDTS